MTAELLQQSNDPSAHFRICCATGEEEEAATVAPTKKGD